MLRRFYTVMIVPHEGGTLRRLSVSMNFVVSMAGIFVFCFVSSAFLAHFFIGGMHRPDQTELLRAEIESLTLDNAHLRSNLQSLTDGLDQIEIRFEQLQRVRSGPEGPPVAMGGALVSDFVESSVDGDWRSAQATREKMEYMLQQIEEQHCQETSRVDCVPVGWPVTGHVTSGWGPRRDPFSGTRQYHEGLDIAAPHGSPVRTLGDGVVVECGRKGGYGNMIRIDHGPDEEGKSIQTLYGHLRRIHVREGDEVAKNDVIGEVGSTGRSTGSHLHYEVLENGVPVNPRRVYVRDHVR